MTIVTPTELTLTYASRTGHRRVRVELHPDGRTARLSIEDADGTEIEVHVSVEQESCRLICEGVVRPKRGDGIDRARIEIEVEPYLIRSGGVAQNEPTASVRNRIIGLVNSAIGWISDFNGTGDGESQ